MQSTNLPTATTIITRPVTRFALALAFLVIAITLLAAEEAEATHYRYGTLSWEGTDTPNEVEFSGSFAARHSFPDFNDPDVGDIIDLSTDLVTGGNFYPTHVKVESINEAHDWLFGSLVDANGDPILHTYNSPTNNGDPHPVSWMDCCRLLEDDGENLNHHVNNHHDATARIRLEAEVDLDPDGARNAKTAHSPITPCPRDDVCTFQIPSDPHFDSVDFRLATSTEAGGPSGFVQPGPPHSDHAAEIDPDTGIVTWNTTGAVFNEVFANNLYSMQVVLEFNGHRTPIDFLIRLTHDDEEPPFWVEPPTPCDETLTAVANTPFSFNVEGQSPHLDRTVTLDHLGLPPGATFTVTPPVPDNPATGTFDWTPTGDDLGTHIVIFRIEDDAGLNGPGCNVSIEVMEDDPELSVDKTADQSPVSAGEQAQFSILVENTGNATAFDVELTDSLPAALSWTITEQSGDATCEITAGDLVCTLEELHPGEGFTVTVGASTSSVECSGPLENTASAHASNQEVPAEDSATIVVECPELEIEKIAAQDPISAGEDAVFTITVTNNGPGSALDVELTDELPAGSDWTPDPDSCDITNNTLTCDVGDLGSGEDFTVTVTASTSPAECGAPLSNTASASAQNHEPVESQAATITVQCPELVVEKTAMNDPIHAGEEAGFTITVTNVGNGTAFDVTLTDELPGGLAWTNDNPACSITGNTMECDIGTLPPDEAFTVRVSASTSASDCGVDTLWNNAIVNASNQEGSSEDPATITVECPELEVVKTAVNGTITAGDDAEFTITVTNIGNGTAFDVTITDDLPPGLTWVDDSPDCSITNSTLTCAVGDLVSGQEFGVTVSATTSASGCGPESLSNTAFADASNQEGPSEDSATITVECPELVIEKAALNDPISAGEDVGFTITVTNIGNATAFAVNVTDDLPDGLDWTPDPDSCDITNNTLTCDVGDLGSGEDFTVTVTASTSPAECGAPLSNTASASAQNHEPVESQAATIAVQCPELVVEKTALNDPISAGEEAGFTITVTNIGNGTAFDVTLTDELPGGLAWTNDNPACSITGSTMECDIGTLPPDEDFTVSVSASTSASDCGVDALWNNAIVNASNQDGPSEDPATITVQCPELEIVKTAAQDPINAGEDAEFTITVTNIGNGTALDVNLTDDLPDGLDWSQDHDSCEITNNTLECDIGTLMTDEAFSVTIKATTSAGRCGEGSISNTAFANASNHDPVQSQTSTITVECPELIVEKTAPQDPISAGEEAGFTMTVTNIGNGTAFDVNLTDDLPDGLDWTHDNPDCDITNNTLECEIGTLPSGNAFTVTVMATTSTQQCDAPLDNTAFATASNQDGASQGSASILVMCPKLLLEKIAQPATIGPGENATYAINVTNIGNGTAFDTVVKDELPNGLDWKIVGDAPDCEIAANATLECTLSALEGGAGLNVTVSAPVSLEDCTLITNNVTLTASNHAPLNDTAVVLCFHAQALAQILYSAITTPESVEYQTHGVDQRGEGEDTRRVVDVDTEAFLGETVLPQVEATALEEHGEVYFDGQTVNVSAHTTATEVRLLGGDIVFKILHNEGTLAWDPLSGEYELDGFYRIEFLEVFGEEISVDGTSMRIDLPGGGHLDLFTKELDDEGHQVTYRSRLAHLYFPVRLEPDLSELPLPLQDLITANATRAEVIVGEVQLRAGFGLNLTGQERLILEPDDAGSGRDASLDEPVPVGTGVYEGGLPEGDESDVYAIEANAGETLAVVLEPATRTWAQGGSVQVQEDASVDPPETTFSLRDYRLRLLDPSGITVVEQHTQQGVLPAALLHSAVETGTYRVVIDSVQDPPAANYTLAVVVAPVDLPLELPLGDPLTGGSGQFGQAAWR